MEDRFKISMIFVSLFLIAAWVIITRYLYQVFTSTVFHWIYLTIIPVYLFITYVFLINSIKLIIEELKLLFNKK